MAFFHLYIVTVLVKLLNKMKQIRNPMAILFLLSFCNSFIFTASVPMLLDDYGKCSAKQKTSAGAWNNLDSPGQELFSKMMPNCGH